MQNLTTRSCGTSPDDSRATDAKNAVSQSRVGHARTAASLAVLIALSGCAMLRKAPTATAYGVTGSPQIFDGMGPHTRKITTDSPMAQKYFNQGLNWMYSFNHDEAVRSFTKAAEYDPQCAMAWWGVAYAQGPNYNDAIMNDVRNDAA